MILISHQLPAQRIAALRVTPEPIGALQGTGTKACRSFEDTKTWRSSPVSGGLPAHATIDAMTGSGIPGSIGDSSPGAIYSGGASTELTVGSTPARITISHFGRLARPHTSGVGLSLPSCTFRPGCDRFFSRGASGQWYALDRCFPHAHGLNVIERNVPRGKF